MVMLLLTVVIRSGSGNIGIVLVVSNESSNVSAHTGS